MTIEVPLWLIFYLPVKPSHGSAIQANLDRTVCDSSIMYVELRRMEAFSKQSLEQIHVKCKK